MRHPFATALLASLLSCSLAWAQDTAKALPPEPLQRVLQSVVTVQSRSDAQASTSRTLGSSQVS